MQFHPNKPKPFWNLDTVNVAVCYDSIPHTKRLLPMSTGRHIGYTRNVDNDPIPILHEGGVAVAFADSSLDAELPEFEKLLVIVRPGDTVVVPSMDRLARTVEELRNRIRQLIELGACVEFLAEKIVFTNENGLSAFGLLSVFGAFNEFQQAILRERQLVKAQRHKQRMAAQRVLTSQQIEELRQRAKSGEEKTKMAREYGISRWTLYKYLRNRAVSPAPDSSD